MSNIKVINQQIEKAKNIKDLFALDFIKDRTIKNYEQIWGRKDGENWYQSELLHMLTLFAEKPELAKCDKMSIWGALMKCAREGLSVSQGHMDLIAYGSILKAEPNYKGMRHQLRSMPKIKFIGEARLVYKEDDFEFDEKKMEVLKHTRKGAPKSQTLDNISAAYVTVEFIDGRNVDVLMWHAEILAAKNKTKNKSEAGPWNTTAWEMAKKTVVKRANKIYFERPQVQVEGFNPLPELEKTQDVDHEEVDTDTGEVLTPEVTQEPQPASPPVQQAQVVSKGMEDFLKG